MRLSAVQQYTLVDYPGTIACVAFTIGCNLRCPYCHNPEMVLPAQIQYFSKDMIEEDVFLNFLEQRRGLLEGVSICGGEPTIQRDLPLFIKRIKGLGYKVKLDTNGSNASMVISMIEEDLLDYVAVDCKTSPGGPLATTGVLLTRTFRKNYLELLDYLKHHIIAYEYRTTIIKGLHTVNIVESIAKLLQGVDSYYLQQYRPQVTLDPVFQGTPYTAEELESLLRIVQQYIPHVGVRM